MECRENEGENGRTFRNDADLVPPVPEAGNVVLHVPAFCEFAFQEVAFV